MYIYCVCPGGNLKSKFLKIDCCDDKEIKKQLKDYIEFYGDLYNRYIIKIDKNISKKDLYETLKINELEIDEGLFILDDNHDFSYYVQKINNLNL